MNPHRRLFFHLQLDHEQCLIYYQGRTRWIQAQATNGEQVRFPADWLRPFMGASGINGLFELVFDEHCKKQSFRRVG